MRLCLPEREIRLIDCERADVEQAFQVLAAQHRYAHYIRMPQRICKSLDFFRAHYERPQTLIKLTAFYLFAGVVDDWFDERGSQEGSLLLARFAEPLPSFTATSLRSAPLLVTEYLKSWVSPDNHPDVLAGLRELYDAIVEEQQADTFRRYLSARQTSGRLTADVSYRLIANEMRQPRAEIRSFMHEVGEVGNLVDSLFDLSGDLHQGVLRFRPTLGHRVRLLAQSFVGCFRLLARYPGLADQFLGALRDAWQDSWRRPALPPGLLVGPGGT